MSLTEVYDIKSNVLHQNQILHAPVVILIISDCDLSCPYALSAGMTSEIAFAAPVVDGIRLPNAERPVLQSFWERLSTTFCFAVAA